MCDIKLDNKVKMQINDEDLLSEWQSDSMYYNTWDSRGR